MQLNIGIIQAPPVWLAMCAQDASEPQNMKLLSLTGFSI